MLNKFYDREGAEILSTISVTTGNNSVVAVSDTPSVKLLDVNNNRKGGLLVNNGSNDVYMGFTGGVVAGNVAGALGGWIVRRGGSSFSLSHLAGYTGEIWAITPAGSTVIAVAEW